MRAAVTVALTAVLAAAVLAPLLAGGSHPAAFLLYAAFSWACHQHPERCWQLAGYPLAVCVRCLGLYSGALAGTVVRLRFSRVLFLLSMALLGADWLAEASGWLDPRPFVRFFAGAVTGFFLVPALLGEQKDAATRIRWMRREVHS